MFNSLTLAALWEDGKLFNIFGPLQLIGIVLLIALVIFWTQYRKRQM